MENIKIKNEWDLKCLRDGWTFPFGSICGMIGKIYEGKDITANALESLINIAYLKALEINEKQYLRAQELVEQCTDKDPNKVEIDVDSDQSGVNPKTNVKEPIEDPNGDPFWNSVKVISKKVGSKENQAWVAQQIKEQGPNQI